MEINILGVVGAGIMGKGIAQVAALAGIKTVLQDISRDQLQSAVKSIETEMENGIRRGKVTQEQKDSALKLISVTTALEDMSACDFIIEAVTEDMGVKLPLFGKLDSLCRPEVILASNTSSQSITEMAAATKRPDKVIGMHFFNPVHKMKLVEMIKGLETSVSTAEATKALSIKLGKQVVDIHEFPGFVTSRMNAVMGNEAFEMLMQGLGSPEDIDLACRLGLNHPMGPFEMIDLVGLDTRLKTMQYLHQTLGEKYRPNPIHIQYVKAGRLGKKAGRGVYEYDENGNRITKNQQGD